MKCSPDVASIQKEAISSVNICLTMKNDCFLAVLSLWVFNSKIGSLSLPHERSILVWKMFSNFFSFEPKRTNNLREIRDFEILMCSFYFDLLYCSLCHQNMIKFSNYSFIPFLSFSLAFFSLSRIYSLTFQIQSISFCQIARPLQHKMVPSTISKSVYAQKFMIDGMLGVSFALHKWDAKLNHKFCYVIFVRFRRKMGDQKLECLKCEFHKGCFFNQKFKIYVLMELKV